MDKNLYEWTRGRRVPPPEEEVKEYMRDLLVGIDHIHRNGIFHRDIKPENVLVSESSLKIADFGSCKGIYSKQPYTEYISTRWYRSPECLMTDGYYSFKMDIWGIGCVFFEVLALFPLFPGKNELDQINKIHNILGTPSEAMQKMFQSKASHMEINFPYKKGTGFEKMIAHASPMAKDLISEMLKYDETERYTAKQALNHPYFYKEPPKVIKILPIIKSTKNALKKSVAFPPIRKKHIPLSKAPKKTYTTLKNHYHMMKKKKLQKNPLHGDLQAQKDIFLSCITDKLLIIEY
jgi:serine/threonine protein kinase